MTNVMNFIKTNRYFPWAVAFVVGAFFGSYSDSFTNSDTPSETVAVNDEAPAITVLASADAPLTTTTVDEGTEAPVETPASE